MILEVYITYWNVADFLSVAKNLGKIRVYGYLNENGSLYYVLECRKRFMGSENEVKKKGQKSENKGFFSLRFS